MSTLQNRSEKFLVSVAEATQWIVEMGLPEEHIPQYNSLDRLYWGGHFGQAVIVLANQEPVNRSMDLGLIYAAVRARNPCSYLGTPIKSRHDQFAKSYSKFGTAWAAADNRFQEGLEPNMMGALAFVFAPSKSELSSPIPDGVLIAAHPLNSEYLPDFCGLYGWDTNRYAPFEDEDHKVDAVEDHYPNRLGFLLPEVQPN